MGLHLLSPTFSVSVMTLHNDSGFLKTTSRNAVIYTLSSHFLHLWGNTAHSLCYHSSGQQIRSHSIHTNACIIISSSIRLDLSFCWLFFTLFSHTLILIRYICNNQFTSMLIHNDCFLQFSSQTRTFSFIYICYLRQCSRVPDMFSPFILTPFAVTGQPGSMNHRETESPSTMGVGRGQVSCGLPVMTTSCTLDPYPPLPLPFIQGYGYAWVRVQVRFFYPRVTHVIH